MAYNELLSTVVLNHQPMSVLYHVAKDNFGAPEHSVLRYNRLQLSIN